MLTNDCHVISKIPRCNASFCILKHKGVLWSWWPLNMCSMLLSIIFCVFRLENMLTVQVWAINQKRCFSADYTWPTDREHFYVTFLEMYKSQQHLGLSGNIVTQNIHVFKISNIIFVTLQRNMWDHLTGHFDNALHEFCHHKNYF